MATIEKRPGKFGTAWRATVRIRGHRESATFDSKAEAAAWAANLEKLLRSGQGLPGEAAGGNRDFAEAADAWQAALERREKLSAASKYMYFHAAKRLKAAFAGRTMGEITRDDVERYRDRRLEEVGAASIRHDFVFLRGLYKHARLEWGLSLPCPVDDVAAPPPPGERVVDVSPEEITRLLDYCCDSQTPLLYSYALLLLLTGMRPSEAASLRWDQVRIAERRIALTKTKTGRGRNVPLADEAVAQLARLREVMPGDMLFFRDAGDVPRIASDHFASQFKRAAARAGLAGLTLYSLRHIAASYLVMSRVDIATVREILGHRSIATTMRYTHINDDHRLAAIKSLDKIGR